MESYCDIMYSTDAVYVGYDPNKKPSSSQGAKWKNIVSTVWKNKPSDPPQLAERAKLLIASEEAGHTNVSEPMKDTATQRHEQKEISDEEY